MFVILGYLSALLMGFILGLLGGGGSILSVPIFLYLYGYSPIAATSYSLFVVSVASFTGFLRQYKNGNVDIKTGLLFAVPSMLSVLLVRRFGIPLIPEEIFNFSGVVLTRDLLILFSFASVMLIAGIKMIKGRKDSVNTETNPSIFEIIKKGSFVGALTGFVGAGGGFLIVPALNVFFKMPIKKAMGTSLMVICINSFVGFSGALNLINNVPWTFLLTFSSLSIVGIFIGTHFNAKINPSRLKKGFGVFVIIMAVFIILNR